MTQVKFCGLRRPEDISCANSLKPDYIGFVFAPKSKRYVEPQKAAELKKALDPEIKAVGVFVNEDISLIVSLLKEGIIDMAQLHGSEDEAYIRQLKEKTSAPIIKAFKIRAKEDAQKAESSPADLILLDSGEGSGKTFNWEFLKGVKRDYFLAGGLDADNVSEAVRLLDPFAVDVSSGIETGGFKDRAKMEKFMAAVRG